MSSINKGKQNKYKSSFKKKTKFTVAVMDDIDETSNPNVTESTVNVDSAIQDITGNITPVLTDNVSLMIGNGRQLATNFVTKPIYSGKTEEFEIWQMRFQNYLMYHNLDMVLDAETPDTKQNLQVFLLLTDTMPN